VDANSPDPAQTLAVLSGVRSDVANPERWTKKVDSDRGDGFPVDFTDPEHVPPAKACLTGHVMGHSARAAVRYAHDAAGAAHAAASGLGF
jgi:hypothetical protein